MEFLINFFTSDSGQIELKKLIVSITVAIIAGALSIAASIAVAIISSKRNKKTVYINIVTGNRIEWIQKLKSLVDTFILRTQFTYFNPFYRELGEAIEYFEEISSLRNKVFLHLNYTGYIDKKIIRQINKIYKRIEIIYEMDRLFDDDDDEKKLEYFIKHYKEEIYAEATRGMDCNMAEKLIKESLQSKSVGPEFSTALNEQIEIFNNNFRKANPQISKEIEELHNELIKYIQVYLKLEWDRVKDESQGNLKSKEDKRYRKKADKMLDEYGLQLYDYELEKLPNYLKNKKGE